MFVAMTRDVTVDFAEVDDELGVTLRVLSDKEAISSVEANQEIKSTHVGELVVELEEEITEDDDVEKELEESELDEEVLVAAETLELEVDADWLDVDTFEVEVSDVDAVVGVPKISVEASAAVEAAESVALAPFPPEAEEVS